MEDVYHFLFETFGGIGVLFGVTMVVCILACIVMERRTRRIYKNHEQTEDDWSFFDN